MNSVKYESDTPLSNESVTPLSDQWTIRVLLKLHLLVQWSERLIPAWIVAMLDLLIIILVRSCCSRQFLHPRISTLSDCIHIQGSQSCVACVDIQVRIEFWKTLRKTEKKHWYNTKVHAFIERYTYKAYHSIYLGPCIDRLLNGCHGKNPRNKASCPCSNERLGVDNSNVQKEKVPKEETCWSFHILLEPDDKQALKTSSIKIILLASLSVTSKGNNESKHGYPLIPESCQGKYRPTSKMQMTRITSPVDEKKC